MNATWYDLPDGGVLELDEPAVELRVTVDDGRVRATWIDSETGEALPVPPEYKSA